MRCSSQPLWVSQNRMHEAISLFGAIVNEDWFRNTSVILFLNKMDLLKKKLETSNLTKYFPDYIGVYLEGALCIIMLMRLIALSTATVEDYLRSLRT